MAQIKVGDPHGLFRVFVGLVDSNGYNYGTSQLSAAEGTQLNPYTVRYAQNAEIAMPDRTVIDFTGGDIWTGSYVYGITSLGTFQLTLSTVEADLIALLSASGVDQTQNTRQTVYGENIMLPTPPQAWMMTVFRIQSKEQGTTGANKFLTVVLPRTWVTPKGISGAPTFQAAGTYGYTIIPTVGDRMPWGPAFSTTALNFSEDQSPNFYVITDNPVHAVGFIAASGETDETITLPFLPVAHDYSTPDSSTQPVQVYIDGVQTNATSINASTGEVVVPADTTFSGGEYIGIFYETNYETAS